ncbi:MAG: hypothetical protein RL660_3053 [Bacteroidota bacterium]
MLLAFVSQPFLHWYSKAFWEDVYTRPRAVLCHQLDTLSFPVLVVESSRDIDSLLAYYERVQLNNCNPDGVVFNLLLRTVSCRDTIYVMNNKRNDSIVEIISTADRGPHFGGTYLRAFAHARYLKYIGQP